VRICSRFFEDLPLEITRPPIAVDALHGRLVMALQIAWGLVCHPAVDAFAICDGDSGIAPGATAVAAANLGDWLGSNDAVWLEPARHYWWRPALIRHHFGVRFPIVTMAHGLGYSRQIAPLIASLAAPSMAGDVVIAPSCAAAAILREQCAALIEQLGLPRQPPNVAVVPYGVPGVVRTPRGAARTSLGWDERPVALFVGRLSEEDKADFAALVAAAAQVRAGSRRFRLVLAGVGSAQAVEVLREHARRAGIADAEVRLNVSEVEKHLLYSGCDLFVSPANSVSESFGLSVVEAMLHGAPVVCTAWSGYREIVRDGVDGFLVPVTWRGTNKPIDVQFVLGTRDSLSSEVNVDIDGLAVRIGQLLDSKTLRRRMGEHGRKRAEARFLIGRVVDDVVAVLAQARVECDQSDAFQPAPIRHASAFRSYADLSEP
jgi:glycosyltransferase involved in cell wall biosynthesis